MSPSADFLGTSEPVFKYGYEATFEILGKETLKFSQSITLPKAGNAQIDVLYKNFKKYIAGISTHQKSNLKVRAFVEPDTAAKCWQWYRMVYPSKGVVGSPKSYKKSGSVSLLDGRGSPISTWQYTGCWPSEIEMGDGSQADATIIEIGLTIEYDDVSGPNSS